MRKRDEISQTKTCLHAAEPDEMVFVLLGRDVASPHAIRQWALKRIEQQKNHPDDPQIVEARACADTMERERDALRARLAATRVSVMDEMAKVHEFEASQDGFGRWHVTCSCGWLFVQMDDARPGDADERQAQEKSMAHFEAAVDDALRASIPLGDRGRRQATITAWARQCFGDEQATSLPQRAVRLLEEAIETYQAAGGSREMAAGLVDFVFQRPPGALAQELGGVSVCLLVMASAMGRTADGLEIDEIERVMAKPIEHFTARNQAKNDAGFLAYKNRTTDGSESDR